MMQDREHAVDTLTGLIEATRDSAEGYTKAAELARNPRFKAIFLERAEARRRLSQELNGEVSSLGGQPIDDGSILGQAHRVFAELRDKISGNSDKAIIEEVERGESFVRERFQKAALDEGLPAQARLLIEKASIAISADLAETAAFENEFG